MEKYSQLVILAEDRMHYSFVSGFVKSSARINDRMIVEKRKPACGANANDRGNNGWVAKRFADEVQSVRRRIAGKRASTLLIAVTDADESAVVDVQKAFAQKAGRDGGDCYALLVPKRAIEAWVLFCLQSTIDEAADLGHPYDPKQARAAGRKAYDLISAGALSADVPPSMQACCASFQKIKDGL